MEIPVSERYVLCGDQYCYWIDEWKEKKQKPGEWYLSRCSGYYRNITDALDSLARKRLGASEAQTVKELRTEMDDLLNEIKIVNNSILILCGGILPKFDRGVSDGKE